MIWDGHLGDGPEDEREGASAWEEGEGDVPFLPEGLHDAAQPWRGLEHPDGWPEFLAGPEYWLLRAEIEDEDGGQ